MKVVADVVIVGAGIIGCSAALALAPLGRGRVIVVEKGSVASGMTKRSSGLIRTHLENESEARLALTSLRFFQSWRDHVGDPCGFSQTGLAVVSGAEQEGEKLKETVGMLKRIGVDTRIVSSSELHELDTHAQVEGIGVAAYEPESGYADPMAAAQALAHRARDLGVVFRTGTLVKSVQVQHGRVVGVDTNAGPIEAPTVVLAAGPWTNRLLTSIGPEIGMRTARVEVAFFDRPPELKSGHLAYLDSATNSYCRPHTFGLTLAGLGTWSSDPMPESSPSPSAERNGALTPDHFDETISTTFVAEVQSRISRRLPAMKQARYVRGHAGLFETSLDGHPILDRVPNVMGLIVVAGFGGIGFTTAPAVGSCIEELIVEGSITSIDPSPFRFDRFQKS